jgi:RHS repeat-associated protein
LTRPNAVNTTYGYDNLSRLLSVTHAKSGTTLDGATYTLDNAGNRTAKTDQRTAVATGYAYDNIYQLLSATPSSGTAESYTYDPVGNRQSSAGVPSYSYNSSNELTSSSVATYGYDLNGNAITKNDSTGITTYAWDFENRLATVTLPGSGGTVSFKYDPFGRRIYKSSSSGTSVFAYDGSDIVEETNGSGALVARYTHGENTDEPLAMLRSSTTSFYQVDGLGSVTSLSNSAGTLAQTYIFDSFGNQTASSGSLTNAFRYTGREFDAETGLYYNRARYYDPAAGRFLGEDPLGFGGDGVNFYAYVGNSPTGFTDLFGLSMDAAKSGLCEISNKKFSGPCRKFLEKLANLAGISVDALISQLQATASDAQNYVYDGPSSTVPLDSNNFPGVSSPGVNTVGQSFAANPGQIALSQFNGSAIFLSGDWGSGVLTGIFSPYANSNGSATSYGLGVLTHELLHKKSVGGGFSHPDMNAALDAVGAQGNTLGRNDIADRIARLCFQGGKK